MFGCQSLVSFTDNKINLTIFCFFVSVLLDSLIEQQLATITPFSQLLLVVSSNAAVLALTSAATLIQLRTMEFLFVMLNALKKLPVFSQQ